LAVCSQISQLFNVTLDDLYSVDLKQGTKMMTNVMIEPSVKSSEQTYTADDAFVADESRPYSAVWIDSISEPLRRELVRLALDIPSHKLMAAITDLKNHI